MTRGNAEVPEVHREHALREHDRNIEQLRNFNTAAIDAANIAIRSLLLINGGASVALLAFVGAVESGNRELNSEVLAEPIRQFALGVGLAVVTAILAYLVNHLDAVSTGSRMHTWEYPYVEETPHTKKLDVRRRVLFFLALLTAGGSMSLYFIGVWSITGAISNLGI